MFVGRPASFLFRFESAVIDGCDFVTFITLSLRANSRIVCDIDECILDLEIV